MAPRTAFFAPAHRVNQKLPPGTSGFAPDAAPNMDFLGVGIQDPRVPYNFYSQADQTKAVGVLGWYGNDPVVVLNQVPAAIVAGNIAAAQNVVNGTAMTLAGASTGITVASALTIWPGMVAGQSSPIALNAGLVLDGAPTLKRFGMGFVTAFYDRATMLSRAVSVTGVAGGAGGAFLVRGYDAYGYAMSEQITATAGATSVNGKKAFKVISSITPQFTDAHNYSFQTTDIFGVPLLTSRFEDTLIHWNSTLITAATGLTAADTTNPATTTTGDVRGTYAVQSASDGVKRLCVRVSLTLTSLQANPLTGLFGQAQV